jgi:EAL domain
MELAHRLGQIRKGRLSHHRDDGRAEIARCYRSRGIHLLAETVETQDELNSARSLGYTYFQGFFFARPAMVEGRAIPSNKVNYLRLLEAMRVPAFSYSKIEEILKQEPSRLIKLPPLSPFPSACPPRRDPQHPRSHPNPGRKRISPMGLDRRHRPHGGR